MDDGSSSVTPPLAPIALLFFLSGASGLIYEVLWTRQLTLVFGHSTLAASTVLAAFMGGLGCGGLAGGRWADRAPQQFLRRYAFLEAGVAGGALLSLPLLQLVHLAHLRLAQAAVSEPILQTSTLVLAALVLFLPTFLMGATLPVLARGLSGLIPEGRVLGLLYGVNTTGACLGAAWAGYWSLPVLGVRLSLGAAVITNLGLAAVAWLLNQRLPAREWSPGEPEAPTPTSWLIPLAAGLAGAASMIFEVGWTRGLLLSLGSSTYALATILAVFLAGMGAGGLVYGLVPAGQPRPAMLGAVHLAAGLWGALASYLLGLLPYLVWMAGRDIESLGGTLILQNVLAALILGGPALLLGLAFPLAVEVYRGPALGTRLARLYAANTAGCVLGAGLAGLWLVPEFGVQTTLKLAALLLVGGGVALAVAGSREPRQRLPALVFGSLAGFLVLGLPAWSPALMTAGISIYGGSYTNLNSFSRLPEPAWYRDGESATISLHAAADGALSMRSNGKTDASTSLLDLSTQYLLGYIPALYTRPRTVAVIGLGSGMTLEALAQVPGVERIDCAELEPAVVEAFSRWQGYNGHVGLDSRVKIQTTDGRTFLETGSEKYDLIVSEPSNVWVAGVGNLFTREFYAACLSRLSERGVMAQWFQNYNVSADEVGMVVNTFFDVFPQGAVWITSIRENDLLLIGTRRAPELDLAWLRQVCSEPAIRRRLFALGLCSTEAILGHYLGSREVAVAQFGGSRLNTDDRPALEFMAARRMFASTTRKPLSPVLTDPAHPLPAGLSVTPELLQASVEGWMNSRDAQELGRLVQLYEAQFRSAPFLLALLGSLQQGLTPQDLIRRFQPALKSPSSRRLATYLLALQLQSRGVWDKAAEWYEKAAQDPPPGAEVQVWVNLGSCLARLGQGQKSIAAYRRGVEAGGGYSALTLLGDALMRAGQTEQAVRSYQRAVAENQLYTPALSGLAQAWLERKDYRRAAAAFREVTGLVSNHLKALLGLALSEREQGDRSAASRAYEQVLRYDPQNEEALRSLYQLETGAPPP